MILGNSKPLGVAATVFLAVAIAGSVAGWRSAVEQRTQTSAELANDVLRASDQIDLLISRLRLATQSLAQGIDPQAGTIGGIDQAIATVDGFRTALAISPAGIVLDDSRTGKPAVGVDVSDRAYVEAHQTPGSDFFVGAPVSSRIDGAWTLPTSNAVRTENGELQAIAVISVSSEYFGSVRQIIGEAGAIPFVRRHGHEGFFPLGDEASPDVLDELFAQSPPFHLRTNAGASVSETPFGHIFFFSSATGNFDLAVVLPQTEINGAFNRRFAGLLFASLVCAVLLGAVSGAFAHSWQARRQQLAHTKRLEERLRLATSAAGVGIWDMDLGTGVLVWDKTMHDLYGVAEKDFNGAYEDWRSRVHPDDIAEAESEFNRCLDSGDSFESRFRIIANESTRYISANASVIKDNAGRPVRMIGANFDVTDQVKREAELEEARQAAEQTHAQMERDALHDALTGIANRRGLERELDAAHDAPRYNLVACIDVDHFKAVNDSLGHEAGDAVLTRVAEILTREVGENGFVARLGGDEFLVLAEGERADREASLLCNSILQRIREPFLWNGETVAVGASIGYALGSRSCSLRQQISNADMALYKAKGAGRNRVERFVEELATAAQTRRDMSDALKGAIATGALVPYFQPQFEAVDGSFFGAEVLVRWQHPDKGLLSPGDFLPIAEDMNLIEEIDRQVFGKSTALLGQWLQAGIQIPKLAINVSGPRLRSPALIEDLSKLPRAVRSRLSLEVLETIYVDSRDSDLEDTIGKLEELGVSLEIDDFGTGHASVSSIIALRPNVIKIDRQFIRDADKKQESLSVFQSIIGVAESVNLPVIAEGIETGSQALLARRLGCKALQGYGLCRPMSADQMHAWVSGRKKQRTAIIDELLADTPSSVRAA